MVFASVSVFSQSKLFEKQVAKTQQSYQDRGYKLVSVVGDSILKGTPLVTSIVDFDYDTYYIVLIMMDGCKYCEYELNYVDKIDVLHPLEYDLEYEDGIKHGLYKVQNDANKTGNFVVLMDSELPYYANVFIFRR